jgi:homocysteine S-methyltransferase
VIEPTPNEENVFTPLAKKSLWSQKIAKGEKVVSVELLPPTGIDPSDIIGKSAYLKSRGVDAINIPDGPRASSRMSALITSVLIEQQAKIETVLHYTCRDRNLLGMQSDLLGAQAIGLRNILIVTGDPPKLGNYPHATGVFDVDAIGLTNMVHKLNTGKDIGGYTLAKATSLSIGVGVNPVHQDFDYEMGRFFWKVDAGAEWAITQPVFDVAALFRFLNYIEQKNLKIPIIAGVWPLVSYRNAMFLHNEVPGVQIPEHIMKRMEQTKTKEEALDVGIQIAREMIKEIQSSVAGIQVSAPFGKIELACKVFS